MDILPNITGVVVYWKQPHTELPLRKDCVNDNEL